MKNILCVIWFAIATSFLFETSWAYGVQEWGYHDHRTVLAYEYTERLAKGLRYVDLKFPYIATHERKNKFAFIRITDLNGYEEGAYAEIQYGGVDFSYVGLRLYAPCELRTCRNYGAVHSKIEIYEYIDIDENDKLAN